MWKPYPNIKHDSKMCGSVTLCFLFFCTASLAFTHHWTINHHVATNIFLTSAQADSINQQKIKPNISKAVSSSSKEVSEMTDFLWACSCCIKHTKKNVKVMSCALIFLLFSASWQFLYGTPVENKKKKMKMHFTDEMTGSIKKAIMKWSRRSSTGFTGVEEHFSPHYLALIVPVKPNCLTLQTVTESKLNTLT